VALSRPPAQCSAAPVDHGLTEIAANAWNERVAGA
jgi:hypothetical protein